MRIKFLSGPRAGQVDHVPNTQEYQVLAATGLIEIIQYKTFQERLADSMPQAAAVPAVAWGVQHCMQSGEAQPRAVLVIKTVNGEQTIYDAPPAGCPADVVAKFRREAAVYAQIAQDEAHKRKVAQEILAR